ncbi:hypothetical protein K440DRAFT_659982 [Wilcoxina mikolae CBS 423.85]|nr:hypothetical protein K440DRAFT_659982 [Wilcoxina mikolae CBS 423.85]
MATILPPPTSKSTYADPDAAIPQAPPDPTSSEKRPSSTGTPPTLRQNLHRFTIHSLPLTILAFLTIAGVTFFAHTLVQWTAPNEFRETCRKMIPINEPLPVPSPPPSDGPSPDPACYSLLSIRLRQFLSSQIGSPTSPWWSLDGWKRKAVVLVAVSSLETWPQVSEPLESFAAPILFAWIVSACRLYMFVVWPELVAFDACWLFACFWVWVGVSAWYGVLWVRRREMPRVEVMGWDVWTWLVRVPTRLWFYLGFSVVLGMAAGLERVLGGRWGWVKTLKKTWWILILGKRGAENTISMPTS